MKCEVIELLQDEMAGVEEDVGARMIADAVEKHFEGRAVVEVFAGMDFEAEIDASFVKGVENGKPALGELVEGGFDQTGGTLRPWIDVGPGERAGKSDVGFDAEICEARAARGAARRPTFGGRRNWHRQEGSGSEAVKDRVVGGMTGDELALEMRREFGDGKFVAGGDGEDFVAVGRAFGGTLQIEEPRVPGRNLHGYVAEARSPRADGVEGVEGRRVERTAREKCPGLGWSSLVRPGAWRTELLAIKIGEGVVLSSAGDFNRHAGGNFNFSGAPNWDGG